MMIEELMDELQIEEYYYKLWNQSEIHLDGKYVLYWMQGSQRFQDNRALTVAGKIANHFDKPLLVIFNFIADYPEANYRHYSFMYEGIAETFADLNDSGAGTIITTGDFLDNVIPYVNDSILTVTDSAYLKPQRSWRKNLAKASEIPLLEIATNTVVPVEYTSKKEEYAARTIRSKITEKSQSELFIWDFPKISNQIKKNNGHFNKRPRNFTHKKMFLQGLGFHQELPGLDDFKGGYSQAQEKLTYFLDKNLKKYEEYNNDPDENVQSNLSPYLHFGQISPREIALAVKEEADFNNWQADSYLEQLMVRRELSFNFVYYNTWYDCFPEALPEWAQKTLEIHEADTRQYIYNRQELEFAKTHDIYWNAAQLELIYTGKIHNYLRMYWGKKILEWTPDPETAFNIALYLNNKYSLDGRDPNSYAGVAWCFGKHDRAWSEREVYGKIRYMNRNGLKRKFKLDDYLRRVKDSSGLNKLPGK
ncbi:MAG: deoxyribodipyrimidine photo-lyase [Bacillota bacterium]